MIFLDATFLTKKGVFCLHCTPKTSVFLGKFSKNGCAHFVHIFTPQKRGSFLPTFLLLGPPEKVVQKWYKSSEIYHFLAKNCLHFRVFSPGLPPGRSQEASESWDLGRVHSTLLSRLRLRPRHLMMAGSC